MSSAKPDKTAQKKAPHVDLDASAKDASSVIKAGDSSALGSISDSASDSTSTSVPSPAAGATQQALSVVLMDDGFDWTSVQQEVLAVAQFLRHEGYAVHIFCPKASPLMQEAKAQELSVMPYGGRFALLWKFKRKQPLVLHAFSLKTAALAEAFGRWRLPGVTLCLHSLYSTPPQEGPALTAALELCKKMQKTIFPTVHRKKLWEKQGLTQSDSPCVYPALALEPWAALHESLPVSQVEKQSQRYIFVVAASLCLQGGLSTVFKSMVLLMEQELEGVNSFEVRVLGSGQDFESLLTEARGLGVESRLALLGEQDMAEVLPWVHALILPQGCASLVSPVFSKTLTQSSAESGDGTKTFYAGMHTLLAAYCLGLPVICAQNPPYTELSQGKMLHFTAENATELYEHMHGLMQDESMRQKQAEYSANMRKFALMPRLQKDYGKVYAMALEQKGWGFLCKKKSTS